MSSSRPGRVARVLASVFSLTTLGLGVALVWGWMFFHRLAIQPIAEPDLPQKMHPVTAPVSPLQLIYKLDLPGGGEIFPALYGSSGSDYWPVAVLSISNTSGKPVMQVISAQVPGWTVELRETAIIPPHEARSFNLTPTLLPRAFDNGEIRQGTLSVEVEEPMTGANFAQQKPVLVHSASDLYWGKRFANAQLLARWVTPHDPAVLQLISSAQRLVPGRRFRGYNEVPGRSVEKQVKEQAQAIFAALQQSRISYVSSIYTFGEYPEEAQRIRLPRETLQLRNANCIDVSVLFSSAIENLGMQPVIIVVPGHAFTGVRLGPGSPRILYLDLTVLPKGSFQSAVRRAEAWMKKSAPEKLLTVDVSAARSLGIYPMPNEDSTTSPQVSTVRSAVPSASPSGPTQP